MRLVRALYLPWPDKNCCLKLSRSFTCQNAKWPKQPKKRTLKRLTVLFVSHRYLQKCVFMFVLGTKNSSGHVQTNFLFGKVPNILEKFPTFCVDVIPSPLSSYGVATLFPLPRLTVPAFCFGTEEAQQELESEKSKRGIVSTGITPTRERGITPTGGE